MESLIIKEKIYFFRMKEMATALTPIFDPLKKKIRKKSHLR